MLTFKLCTEIAWESASWPKTKTVSKTSLVIKSREGLVSQCCLIYAYSCSTILAHDLTDTSLTSVNWQCNCPFTCSQQREHTIEVCITSSKGVKSGPYCFVLAQELTQPDPHLPLSVSNGTEISTYFCFSIWKDLRYMFGKVSWIC